jgi:hypothetical protein
MLLDERHIFKTAPDNRSGEMIASSLRIGYLYLGTVQTNFNEISNLHRFHLASNLLIPKESTRD